MREGFVFKLYALAAVAFWGISFVSSKSLLQNLDPYTIVASRFGLASLLLGLAGAVFNIPLAIRLKHLPQLVILGVSGVFIHQWIQVLALQYIDAVSAGWLIACSPVFTVILSAALLGENMTKSKGFGMAAALAGVLFVASSEGFKASSNAGVALMVLSTLNWAIYSILLKKLFVPYPIITIAFYTSVIGSLLMLPFTIRNGGWHALVTMPDHQWAHLLFLAIFVSAAAYWFWGKALSRMNASSVAAFLYIEPLFTLAAGAVLLQERMAVSALIGGAMILFGVYWMNKKLPA
ncbi:MULTISPECIES: DMT family transporter [Bacillaceae]|uniref:DMT family transporter n=1 Tax=Metabacillus sediminis TaxID=3117746 RepID=A0ABZ2NBN3_9BACI|nr:DMT family transporter [Bacillus sp. SJS]KZZ82610.1 hypothetical protein AS29_017490 [Bacillus sp. SJS]